MRSVPTFGSLPLFLFLNSHTALRAGIYIYIYVYVHGWNRFLLFWYTQLATAVHPHLGPRSSPTTLPLGSYGHWSWPSRAERARLPTKANFAEPEPTVTWFRCMAIHPPCPHRLLNSDPTYPATLDASVFGRCATALQLQLVVPSLPLLMLLLLLLLSLKLLVWPTKSLLEYRERERAEVVCLILSSINISLLSIIRCLIRKSIKWGEEQKPARRKGEKHNLVLLKNNLSETWRECVQGMLYLFFLFCSSFVKILIKKRS